MAEFNGSSVPLAQHQCGLPDLMMGNARIELLHTSKGCKRFTPAALPPVEHTRRLKDLRVIWDCLCRDRELLQRRIIISCSHPEPLAQGEVRLRQVRGYAYRFHGQGVRLTFPLLRLSLVIHPAVPHRLTRHGQSE